MSGWRCPIYEFLLTILLELTYQRPLSPSPASTKSLLISYSICSTVVSYAHTVTSALFNPYAEVHDATFDLDLPHLTFISNFTKINNKVYIVKIKEKHQTKKIYEKTHQLGKTAAHISIRDQESEEFHISINLAAGEVTFTQAYEELLNSTKEYQLVVSMRPGQLVRKLSLEITVSERRGNTYAHIPPLRTTHLRTPPCHPAPTRPTHADEANSPPSTRMGRGETCVVTFCPTLQDRRSAFSSSGAMADFVVQYDVVMEEVTGDVERKNTQGLLGVRVEAMNASFGQWVCPPRHGRRTGDQLVSAHVLVSGTVHDAGEDALEVSSPIRVNRFHSEWVHSRGGGRIYGGYFIHYFAPRGFLVERNVVFVIDVSGSKFGTKMKQTEKAMSVILSDLQANDYFHIIYFSEVSVKSGSSIQATMQNSHSAKDYLGHREDDGWTDINAALLEAVSVLKHSNQESGKGPSVGKIPLIIFLTDGETTASVTTSSVILPKVRQVPGYGVSFYSLAFGGDADFPLLCRLSLENRGGGGGSLIIYEDPDVVLQLEGFCEEISVPLLADVHLDDLGSLVGASPWALSSNYFGGSELMVAHQVQPGEQELGVHLAARGPEGQPLVDHQSEEATNSSQAFGCPGEPTLNMTCFICQLWAYVSTGELLEAHFHASHTTTPAKVLNLSLEYNFVTPLTSVIVVSKEASEEAGRQSSNTSVPGTITSSSSSGHALRTGTAQPALMPRVSHKSRPVKATSTTSASTNKMPSSKELEPLSQGSSSLSTLLYLKPKTPAQQDSDTPSHPQPGLLTSQSPKSLPESRSTPNNLPCSRLGILLPRRPKIPSPLKPSASPHQTSTSLSFSKRNPTPHTPESPLFPRPVKPKPPPPQSLSTFPNTISSCKGPSSTVTTSFLGQLLICLSTPRMPPLLPTGRLWHQQDLPLGPHTRQVLGTSLPGVPTMGLPSGSRPMPEGRLPNLPNLLPSSSTLLEAISLLLLPEVVQSLSESMAESKFVESWSPPAFYIFLPPDKDGSTHWDGDSEEMLGGAGESAESQGSSVGLAKVDGDPHFVMHIPPSQDRICFTLMDLIHACAVSDYVNAQVKAYALGPHLPPPHTHLELHMSRQLLGTPPRPGHEDQTLTYFQIITVTAHKPLAYIITVSRSAISVQGEGTLYLFWDQPALVRKPHLEFHVAAATLFALCLGPYLEFLILQLCYRHRSTLQLPHLFCVANGSGLSPSAHDLMGQPQHTDMQLVTGPTGSSLWRHHRPDMSLVLGKRLLKDSPGLPAVW
ncbi:LOW QUALITY PROTEIN: inter-alpha-trypsin inhibitor heavy chain H6 [Erethizon dorsatum]